MSKPPARRRRSWPVVTVFVGIVSFQVLVAAISIDLLSAVRSYVTGESLYSKGQKDAQIHLIDYAESHREEDYRRFLSALAVPLGDRAAREELQKAQPDPAVALKGFLDGGNHPDDIPGLIRLFRWFHDVPFMAEPIATWTEGDMVIQQMRELAERAHERLAAGDAGSAAVSEMRTRAPLLNQQLTRLESKFSAQLGEASRQTQRLLLGLNLALAVLLGLTGLGFVRHSSRVQALTEAEVRRRQESLQRLLDSAAEGLFGVDLQGKCTFINRAALDMLGHANEADLLGQDIHALIHHAHADGRPHPASESRIYQAFRQQRELHVADEVFWRRDGSSFPVEYWSHPMFQNGQVQGAVATFFDITERVQMQAALREGELRMARLVDAVTDGVITIDARETVVFFNRAAEAMFGVTAAEAIGSPITRFIPRRLEHGNGKDATRVVDGHGEAALFGGLHELTGRRADARTFPIEASLSTLETGTETLITVVLRDVTQQHAARAERQMREALEATSRAKTEFLSRMSHELRTPLNAVLGFSQLLRLDAVRPPSLQQLERIQHIENAGSHLLALVNDVLDLSRVESGQMTTFPEAVDLRCVLADALVMVSALATEAHVELRMSRSNGEDDGRHSATAPADDEQGDAAWATADPVRLRQVLVNLLSNAVKYNRAGGRVTVSWAHQRDGWHVRIGDTGLGMTPDKLARLFEPFNRLGAEKTKIEGTGIGLVLSRRLVELMNGELTVDSVVGRGTTATVILPSAEEPDTGPGALAPPSQHGVLDRGLSVLYAEDDEVNAELVRQVAGLRPGVALRVAGTGAAALKIAQQELPDLMLIDMNLGDMTGAELARALRQNPITRSIRLVALSADALPEQIDAAIAGGFESYLTKPIDFRRLLNLLDGKPSMAPDAGGGRQ